MIDSLSHRKNNRGQAAVEYILLFVVMASIITSLLMYMKKRLGNPEDCDKSQNARTLLCRLNSFVTPTGGSKPFQYFPFKK